MRPIWRLLTLGLLLGLATGAAAEETDCSAASIAKQRRAFQAAYDAKDYDRAQAILEPVWRDCIADRSVDPVLAASIDNDLALTAHRMGDDGACLELLMDYAPAGRRDNPIMARLPTRLRQAIRYNFGLCQQLCATSPMDARCQSADLDRQRDGMVTGDFRAAACPFDSGGNPAVALPDGQCLAILPPREPVDWSERAETDPATACPQLALVRSVEGKPVSQTLAVPATSFLRHVRFCCADTALAIDGQGRIELTPVENPPEDCLFGHRTPLLQDVFTLQGRRLLLRHRMFKTEE